MHACICIFMSVLPVWMQMNEPVFLKGKSSLLSMGDGRVYWQVGDVPPRGGELWSSDVWWEDLIKRRQRDDRDYVSIWFVSSSCFICFQATTRENTYVYQSFWWWIIEWFIPLPLGSFADLLNRNSWSFCFTSVLATAPVRPKEGTKRDWGYPRAMIQNTLFPKKHSKTSIHPLVTYRLSNLFHM